MSSKPLLLSLAFAVVVTAGCAQQPTDPPQSEGERLAAEYPDSSQLAIPTKPSGPHVVATGLDQTRHFVRPDVYTDHEPTTLEVLRGGRYALIDTNPTLGQRDLLEQTVDISIPSSLNPTVEDAIHYTLRHTGFTLCPAQGAPQTLLYGNPLPAVHRRLGPMPLHKALTVLAGPAWEVQVDPIARLVCYQVRDTLATRRPSLSL